MLEGYLYLTKNWWSNNKIFGRQSHLHVAHNVQKGFEIRTLIKHYSIIDKVSIFHEIAQNFTNSQES